MGHARKTVTAAVALALAGALLPGLAPAASANGHGDKLTRAPSLQPGASHGRAVPAPTRVIVKYKRSLSTRAQLHALGAKGLQVRKNLPLIGARVVAVPRGQTAAEVVAHLRNDPNVEYAEPDVVRVPLATAPAPNDPYFGLQWGMRNRGQAQPDGAPAALPGVDVDALGAWGLARGSSSVTVAVIDEGLDVRHPDLKSALWTNSGESGTKANNGIDDDGNGFVDDVHGWDFFHNAPLSAPSTDDNDHGTHVAGIIGATAGNGEGIAGLASGVRIMSLKFMGADANGVEGGSDSDAIAAIAYAKSKGVRVMNASWGGPGDPSETDSLALKDAIRNCACVFVAAAGNGDDNGVGLDTTDPVNRVYPAAFDNLPNKLSVASVSADGQLSSFSNYGSTVDLAAPGDWIASTISTLSGSYAYGSGTSMATPFVSATAALMMSAVPSPNPDVVVSLIKDSVTRTTTLEDRVATGGMLDSAQALRQLLALPQPERLSGVDRYATAAAVAEAYEPGVPVAYVATGRSFPDALAGAALAGAQHAPLLLVTGTSVPAVTAQALTRLKPASIVVLGGPVSVSNGTMTALTAYATGGSVTRLAGPDRYSTAAAVGDASPAVVRQVADGQPIDAVYVASGVTFPDALAGAARAGADGQPVLLTTRDQLPSVTAQRLAAWKPQHIYVLGGPASVSSAVEARLASYGAVSRLAGEDRFGTAAAVARTFGSDVASVFVANGEAFPDALAGAALAASQKVPVLLTKQKGTPRGTVDGLTALSPGKVVILGGEVSVASAAALGLGTYAAP